MERGGNTSLRQVNAASRTIDSLFHQSELKISLIKCDVEGHELQCIKGAARIIMDMMPAWIIEISGDPDDVQSKASDAFTLLREAGYHAYWFDGKTVIRRRPYHTSITYFFFASKYVSALKGKGFLTIDG